MVSTEGTTMAKQLAGRLAHDGSFSATNAADADSGSYYAAWWPAANAIESTGRTAEECALKVMQTVSAGTDCYDLVVRRCTRRLYDEVELRGGDINWTVDDLGTADLR
jgi:hypothetical protein